MTTAWKARNRKVNRCQGCRDDSSMAKQSDLERNKVSHYSLCSKRFHSMTPYVTLLGDSSKGGTDGRSRQLRVNWEEVKAIQVGSQLEGEPPVYICGRVFI